MSLIEWINTHDCGVTPTAVMTPEGSIAVRVLAVHADGSTSIETTEVFDYQDARDALGY
jgi:hypothetical protein